MFSTVPGRHRSRASTKPQRWSPAQCVEGTVRITTKPLEVDQVPGSTLSIQQTAQSKLEGSGLSSRQWLCCPACSGATALELVTRSICQS